MRCSTRILLSLLIPIALTLSCVRFVGPEDVRQDLSSQAGVKLKQETGFTVTRSGIWLARKFVDDDEVPLKGIRRVEVGIYEVKGLRRGVDEPANLNPRHLDGWEPIVRVHEEDEDVMVLVKQQDEMIRAMLIVVAEEDEWVLVRVRGKLNRVLEQAMKTAFDNVERPELYVRTREERGLDPDSTEDSAIGAVSFLPEDHVPEDFWTCMNANGLWP
jgi:hypothetical protein